MRKEGFDGEDEKVVEGVEDKKQKKQKQYDPKLNKGHLIRK
jgi:hypothetical protein